MEEQLDVMTEESLGRSSEAWRGEELAAPARCVYCGGGMAHNVLPRFNRGYGIVVLIVGILLAMFLSLLLGLPMVVIGAYMGAANRAVWTCRACGAVVDRIGT
ncbi:MAG: hypothetical protein ACYSU0_03930 [Planctomycetota bacterium]|jgi:ABC-type phosphate transport system permease subunit